MRLLWGLLLAYVPLQGWAGPAPLSIRLSAPGPALSCPACRLISPSSSLGQPLTSSLSAPLPLVPSAPLVQAPQVSVSAALQAEAPVFSAAVGGVESLAEAPDDASREQALSEIFEGLTAGDGAPVYPQLITPDTLRHEGDVAQARSELRRAAAAALPALERSVWRGGWRGPGTTLDDSCCGDAAPKLGLLLRQMGQAVDLVEAEFHYYLIARLSYGEVIIDPTIRQFFGGARAPPGIPKVFVGTAGDLQELFSRYSAAKTTSYDVRRIYFRDAVVRNAKIGDLRQAAQDNPDEPQYRALLAAAPASDDMALSLR